MNSPDVDYTSAYLLSRFLNAQVVALEPFPANAELCRRNLSLYGRRATVIEAAVWRHNGRLVLDHAGGNEWGVRVRTVQAGEHGRIEAIDLPSLGLRRVDLLRIDIEGSEANLSADGTDRWLPRVSNIVTELHGSECEGRFQSAMANYRYTLLRSGELTIRRDIVLRD